MCMVPPPGPAGHGLPCQSPPRRSSKPGREVCPRGRGAKKTPGGFDPEGTGRHSQAGRRLSLRPVRGPPVMEPESEMPVLPDPTSVGSRPGRWRHRLAWVALFAELGLLIGFALRATVSHPDRPVPPAAGGSGEQSDVADAGKAAPRGLNGLDDLLRS